MKALLSQSSIFIADSVPIRGGKIKKNVRAQVHRAGSLVTQSRPCGRRLRKQSGQDTSDLVPATLGNSKTGNKVLKQRKMVVNYQNCRNLNSKSLPPLTILEGQLDAVEVLADLLFATSWPYGALNASQPRRSSNRWIHASHLACAMAICSQSSFAYDELVNESVPR
nr:hypothetical protein CFP56_31687 [Quercus suber]